MDVQPRYGLDVAAQVLSMTDVIHRVVREAAEECSGETCPIAVVLDECARDAVAALWDSPIKTFVPLLALRQVRECIHAGTCSPTRSLKL